MGREIRRVPLHWEHPKDIRGVFCPLLDRDVESEMLEWLNEFAKWKAGKLQETITNHPEYGYKLDEPYRSFCSWHGKPPDPKYYRPKWPNDAVMGYAVYENVSEGTPVSPTCATKEELVDYLVEHGDFWDQHRGCGGWKRESAERFVKEEYRPSGMITISDSGISDVKMARDM